MENKSKMWSATEMKDEIRVKKWRKINTARNHHKGMRIRRIQS